MKKHLFSITLLVLALACNKKKEDLKTAVNEDVIAVTLTTVQQEVVARPVVATGQMASSDEARLGFKIGGVIEKIFVKEGQTVAKGQLLATLNQTEIAAQVNQAKEGVSKAERDVNRIGNLFRDSVATKEQYQNVGTALNVAKENLQIAQFNQQYAQIRAAMSGKILRKMMNEGEVVGPGSPVFFVMGTGSGDWVIKVGLADKDWARVRIGDKANVTMDAYPSETFSATVSKLADIADPTTGTFATEISIRPNGKKFASGLVANVSISKQDAVATTVVPIEALVEANEKTAFIYTVANGKAHRIPVSIGGIAGNKALITNGLENTKEVVLSGAMFLSEGMKVKAKVK